MLNEEEIEFFQGILSANDAAEELIVEPVEPVRQIQPGHHVGKINAKLTSRINNLVAMHNAAFELLRMIVHT